MNVQDVRTRFITAARWSTCCGNSARRLRRRASGISWPRIGARWINP